MNINSTKTALITGGAKRIGKAIAINLAKQGYDIIIHYNNSKLEAEELQKDIIKIGVNCQIIKADLLNKDEVEEMILQLEKINSWNLLINNASTFHQSNFLDSDVDELDKNLTIHLKIPAILSQALAKNCQQNQLSGNIINMIDKNITRYETKYFHYLLSKKSLAELTKMLAIELAPNIRVNGIAPGFILNNIYEQRPHKDIPLKKQASESDIISGINYLLNNDFITGEILFIDGGASLNHAG